MQGRITSVQVIPAANPFGVPYHDLLAAEQEANRRLQAAYRAALKAWLAAADAPANSKSRKALLHAAADQTRRLLS